MKQRFIPLPVDRLVEVNIDVGDDGTYTFDPSEYVGCRVKVVVSVPEEWAENINPAGIAEQLKASGAIHVKTPVVRVLRKDVVRDERHVVDLPLDESLRLFAEETKISDAERRIDFAAGVAREADAT